MVFSLGRRLQLDDLYHFVMVSDPRVSPDLGKLALVEARIDRERDDYTSNIWVLRLRDGEPIQFLSGGRDHHPRWSPDGGSLLFLSRRGMGEGERGAGLYVAPIGGGEPRLIVKMREGIEQPEWRPDGREILFMSSVGESPEDVRIVDRVPLWFDAAGFVHHKRRHLHSVDVASGNINRLTEGDINVNCFCPSNDGGMVAYASSSNDLDPRRMELYVQDLRTGERWELLKGYYIEAICWSPDDKHLALLASDLERGYATHLGVWTVPRDGGKAENLIRGLDRGCGRRVYYDLRSPFAGIPAPIWDGDHIYFPISEGGRFNLYRLHPDDGHPEEVIGGDLSIEEFSVRGGVIAYTRVTATEPAEVWVRDWLGDRRLTRFNDRLLSMLELSEPERFEFQASDGERVEGWILKPRAPAGTERIPAIMDIHGGPKSKFGYSFMFEHQLYAAMGYAVIYVNSRGSDGYSGEFADIRRAYGTRDYRDLMEALDFLISSRGDLDPDRLGVTGLSYGGFMTNWIVTQTDRFKAAISQNGICSWPSFFGTTDIGFYFAPDQIGGDPWSNEEGYRRMSPITYAPMVKTPIMFVHSYHDYRCWIDQSIMFYTALKYLGKEARLALFMEGSHVFRSTGKPSIRKKRLEEMLEWFDTHLKGAHRRA
jgi:acylaminoacyl-peptidase